MALRGSSKWQRMRRNKQFINLRDVPLYPRRDVHSRLYVASDKRRLPLIAYFVVSGSILMTLLFWANPVVQHKEVPVHHALALVAHSQPARPQTISILSAPEAPAPDMSSEAVQFANSDVVTIATALPGETTKPIATAAGKKPVKVAAIRSKKKKMYIAKTRRPEEGVQSYALGFADSQPAFGGFHIRN